MKVNIRFKSRIKAYRQLWGLVLAFLGIGRPAVLLAQVSHSVSFSRSNLVFSSVTAEDGITYEKVSLGDL